MSDIKPPNSVLLNALGVTGGALGSRQPPAVPKIPLPRPRPATVVDQAHAQFPILKRLGVSYTQSPGRSDNFLEFWPSDEPGDASFKRPAALPMGKPGIELYRKDTRPIDIMGDVASHYLVGKDPVVTQVYNQFSQTLQPWQEQNLRAQYDYAKKSEGEKRPYEQWKQVSGLPAYFRGYAFQQWGPEAKKYYTPEQLRLFDAMVGYLSK